MQRLCLTDSFLHYRVGISYAVNLLLGLEDYYAKDKLISLGR